MSTVLGSHHPTTLGAMEHLAIVYQAQGRLAEAEELYSRSRELKTLTFGTDHPSTVNSLSYLADVQFLQQRYDAAAVTYHSLLEVRTRVSGTAHPQTLFVMRPLAWALHKQGRRRSAVELMVRCAALSSQTLGPSHPDSVERDAWARKLEADNGQEYTARAVGSQLHAMASEEMCDAKRSHGDDLPGAKGSTEATNEKTLERESSDLKVWLMPGTTSAGACEEMPDLL